MNLSQAFENIVLRRRSNRRFDMNQPVPDEVIQRSLERAILSPNSSNMQLWEFYWVQSPEEKSKYEKLCLGQSAARTASHLVVFVTRQDLWKSHAQWNIEKIKSSIQGEPSKSEKRALDYYRVLMPLLYRTDILGLSTLIRRAITLVKGFNNPFMRFAGLADQRVMVHKSCALAAQTFMLSIAAEGYDTCPMEGFDSKLVKRALQLPKGAEITMIVAVGKGTEEGIYGKRNRLDFDEVVFKR
ncbi:nitroreductase family protein [Aquirufa rosea]|uniref:Nitroreductase family protein n=1 Tax=Aquirufa rosea TaxID=2509241 RepID=A0A4Q1C049_9BACT|nr:nitroreductase family protein [Aquirufa rosea]RXK49780.1 nitroreductase family protein [Aquirufa rosea]